MTLRNDLNQDIATFTENMDYALRNILHLYTYKGEENAFKKLNDSEAKFIDDIKEHLPDLLEKVMEYSYFC